MIFFHMVRERISQRYRMIHYRLFSEHLCGEELGTYETYGIIAEHSKRIIRVISDISCEKEKVQALVDLYNTERLSPEHLDEMIESFLYDFEV